MIKCDLLSEHDLQLDLKLPHALDYDARKMRQGEVVVHFLPVIKQNRSVRAEVLKSSVYGPPEGSRRTIFVGLLESATEGSITNFKVPTGIYLFFYF